MPCGSDTADYHPHGWSVGWSWKSWKSWKNTGIGRGYQSGRAGLHRNCYAHPVTDASWIEVSRSALEHNLRVLRQLAGPALVAPVVKANAYGHGLRLCAEAYASHGVTMLCVNELAEAESLADVDVDVYVLGPTLADNAPRVAAAGCHVLCASVADAQALGRAGAALGVEVPVHVKVETGTNRQGLPPDQARTLMRLVEGSSGMRLAGVATHLADVEDETEHTFARVQLNRFQAACEGLSPGVLRHCASSAAQMLFPDARLDMVRPGIASYGLWPSEATRIASAIVNGDELVLRPVLSWRTRIVQIKHAPRGGYVGYGRTVRLARDTTIGVLPVGYFDGYDRRLSGVGSALVRGRRVKLLGRVCMNMCMVDVTDLAGRDGIGVEVGDTVTLLGVDGDERIPAEELASLVGTIHYEITTRIHGRLPRRSAP